MKIIRIFFIGIVAFALALILGVVAGDVYAEEPDNDSNVILCDECAQRAVQVECTLIVPDEVVNGEVFTAQVNYSPAASGSWKEIFIFRWPSKTDDFGESTIRTKKFVDYSSASASFEEVVTPVALNIEGTFEAKVRVIGDVSCKAKKVMTVINP